MDRDLLHKKFCQELRLIQFWIEDLLDNSDYQLIFTKNTANTLSKSIEYINKVNDDSAKKYLMMHPDKDLPSIYTNLKNKSSNIISSVRKNLK